MLPCCRLILGAAARPAPSPVAGSAPAPQCARAPAASGSGPPGGWRAGTRQRAQGKEAGGREREREKGGVIYSEQGWKPGYGKEAAQGKRGGRGGEPASCPSVSWLGFFRGRGQAAASCPDWVAMGTLGPFGLLQEALPLQPCPGARPAPTLGLFFAPGTGSCAQAVGMSESGNDLRIPGPQACAEGGQTK